jgi:hypothetical protein
MVGQRLAMVAEARSPFVVQAAGKPISSSYGSGGRHFEG